MASTHHKSFRADDRSYFALVKKDIQKIAVSAGFGEVKAGKIDIIVSEMTSNFAKHASGGELLVALGVNAGGQYIEIIAHDTGPGISDPTRMLSDGYSSVSTMGHGLGSIRRLSDQFDLYSLKGWGTIVWARIYTEDLPHFRKQSFEFNGVNVSKAGEKVSGDGYCLEDTPMGFKVLVADGLGHGMEANHAVQTAIEAFRVCEETSPTATIRYLHNEIRKTRGLVGVVIFFDAESRNWNLAGVGNISVRWMGRANVRTLVCYNGIIGHNIPNTMNDQLLTAEEFPQFIACSDGIRSRWDLTKFPMIYRHHGAILATAIYKEYARGTDDVSVIVCKSN